MNSTITTHELNSKKSRMANFHKIPQNEQGFVLLSLSNFLQENILKKLNNEDVLIILDYLDPDKATDLLQRIPQKRREKLTTRLNKEIRDRVEYLLKFDPRTAAGIMSLDYIEIDKNDTLESVAEMGRKHIRRTGRFPALLVVEKGYLVGELPVDKLAIAKRHEKVSKYIKPVYHLRYDAKESSVLRTFKSHPHNKIVVLDKDWSIMGVIYSDDVLEIIQKKSTNSLRNFAGIREEEDILDPAGIKVSHRYKWLIINLATAFLAASVVGLFENTIAKFVILAVYLPIVAGMGGNAGTQTLAVTVRGIALKEIDFETAKKPIINEVIAGAINGLITGSIAAVIAFIWNESLILGFIVGMAMIANLVIASFFGSIIPLVMKRLGKDPATSATIFITTATDVFGFLAFLGLATLILQ